MSDIFREVDEEIRHERYKRLWDRFGPYLIAVALLIVVGTAAFGCCASVRCRYM